MEDTIYDKKSLKLFTCKNPDWKSLAKDCVCFANAKGGIIAIGIENNEELPHANQRIPEGLDETIRKRISELTINVGIAVSKETGQNRGEWIKVKVFASQSTI